MARKVVVPDDKSNDGVKVKKKRSKCCTCCIVALIVSVVLLAVIFCVGWFLGDKYLKQYFGVTMKDTMSVVTSLYGKKDKHVVTNPYNASDLDGFYSEIKENILLKSDADIDFDAALESAINKYLGISDEADSAQIKSVDSKNEGSADGSSESGDEKGEIIDVFVDMIAEVFTRENIDVKRLGEYSEDNDTYIFTLRDKQLAAFVSSVLDIVLDNASKVDMLSSFSDMIDLKKVVKLKQIRFGAVSAANELGENSIKATTADVTVWIGVQEAAGQALRSLLNDAGAGWAGGIVAWLGNVILPKNLYATITIPLYGDDAEAQITLNDMSSAKRDKMYKLINGILSSTGSDQTIQEILGGFADKIKPILETAVDKIDFGDAANGDIGIDLIGAMADMASKNLDSSDPLTKSDFMYLLQALLTSDAETRKQQLEPYLYEGWYRAESDPESEPVYDPADKTGFAAVDYKNELRDEIEEKYCLDVTDPETGEKLPLDELFKILGISFDNSESSGETDPKKMLDWVKPGGLKGIIDSGADTKDLKLNITDRMLGALLSDQMSSIVSSGAGYENLELILDALTFTKRPIERPGHMYATIAVELDLTALLDFEGDNMLAKLAANILPERILLTVDIDITGATPDSTLAAGDERDPVSFMFNDYSNTDNVLDTLGKLMPDLNIGELTVDIENTLVDMLDKINEMLNISLVASDPKAQTVEPGAIVMPDVFTVITDLVLIEKENGTPVTDPVTGKNKTVVTAEQLKDVIAGLENNEVEKGAAIATDYSRFVAELTNKYYLNTEGQEIKKFSDLTTYIQGDFSAEKFNITGDDISKKYLAYDARSNSALHPILTGSELGLVISENMGESIDKYAIESVKTFGNSDGESGIIAILSIKIGDLMPSEVKSLISADKLYITARIVTSEVIGDGTAEDPKRHPITFEINNMAGTTRENTLKIVKCFMPDFDLDAQLKDFGKILYEQLNSLTESLGGSEGNSFISFTDDGVMLKSFYEFLATKLEMPDANPDLVKAAVQGMYTKSDKSELANGNNYLADTFVKNATPEADKGVFDEGKFLAAKQPDGSIRVPSSGDKGEIYTDTQFNDFLSNTVKNMSYPEDSGARAIQTLIVKAGDESETAKYMRSWLNDGKLEGQPIKSDKDYLVVTFEMVMDSYAQTDKGNASVQTFLPASVYATVVFEKTGDATHTEFTLVNGDGLVFNDMRYDAYEVLVRLMGMEASDPNTVNISTITKKASEVLNGFCQTGYIDFFVTSSSGVGEMQFTYRGVDVPALTAVRSSVDSYSFI